MDSILKTYEKLKSMVIECSVDGEVRGKEHDLKYHTVMDNLIRKAKSIENLNEEYKWLTSSDSLYKKIEEETGIVRIKKNNPLTLDRLKVEVEESIASNFSNGDKWKFDIKNYARQNGFNFEEVMHLLGYENYKSPDKSRTLDSSIKELEEWANFKDGYLDGVFYSDVEPAIRFVYKYAKEKGIDGSLYLMLMSDKLKFHNSKLYYDHFDVVERRYQAYIDKYGNNDCMKEKDPTLYNMLLHEADYAPGGSVGVDTIRMYHGFESTFRKERRKDDKINLGDLYSYDEDETLIKITENKVLHKNLVKQSLRAGTSVKGFLSFGFNYKNGVDLPRLSRVGINWDDLLYDIKMDLKKAWVSVGVNSDSTFEEKEKLALDLYNKELERAVAFLGKTKIKVDIK